MSTLPRPDDPAPAPGKPAGTDHAETKAVYPPAEKNPAPPTGQSIATTGSVGPIAKKSGITVPFPRALHVGYVGKDVTAAKRALSRAGYITWGDFTPVYGHYMDLAVIAFEKAHSITPTGMGYGPKVHEELRQTRAKGHPTEWAFDSYSISLEKAVALQLAKSPDQRVREAIVAAGFFWLSRASSIPYSEYRAFDLCRAGTMPTHPWDCSAYVTNCHYAGGAPNPNGVGAIPRAWDGQGYTGTLMGRGVECALSELELGDLVFYGRTTVASPAFPIGSPTHVALYAGKVGKVPMVLSNGHHPIVYAPVSYRTDVNSYRHYTVV